MTGFLNSRIFLKPACLFFKMPKKSLSAKLSLAAGLAFFGVDCMPPIPIETLLPPKHLSAVQNPVERYALLISAATEVNTKYNSNIDPIDEDCDSLNLFRAYATLISNGYPDEHIFVLYSNGARTPNFDVGNPDITKRIREQFSGRYDNTASESNIESVLDGLKKRLDDNDKLVFYISAHGDCWGSISLETGSHITPDEFQAYITGWKSNSNWFLLMNCFGGTTLDLCSPDNVCMFSATESNTLAWGDRNWCGGERFLKYKADLANDTNKDGIVDTNEAAQKVEQEGVAYWEGYLHWYLTTQYSDNGIYDPEDISLKPKVKVGKGFKEANLR